jgi:hypothetical protein
MRSSRRWLVLGIALAAASSAWAADRVVTVELKKVFPYLNAYYDLPAAARTRFELVYRLTAGGGTAGVRMFYAGAGDRVAAPLAADGRVMRLPSPAMYKTGYNVEASAPAGTKFAIAMSVEPSMRPAPEVDARELAAAVRQAAEGVRRSAGVFGFAAPKMERVVFKGAQGGVLVTTSGQSRPLAVVKGSPVFDPAKASDAVRIRFSRAPTTMAIGPAR